MKTIKEIRSSTGLSRSEFCGLLNIPKRTLEKWENGERACPVYVIELIEHRVRHDPQFKAQGTSTRKPRTSKQMLETQQAIHLLLVMSGYGVDYKEEDIEVDADSNYLHVVRVGGQPFGAYNYKTGVLKLGRGTHIPLKELDEDEALVVKTSLGVWEPHPSTQKLIMAKILAKMPTIEE